MVFLWDYTATVYFLQVYCGNYPQQNLILFTKYPQMNRFVFLCWATDYVAISQNFATLSPPSVSGEVHHSIVGKFHALCFQRGSLYTGTAEGKTGSKSAISVYHPMTGEFPKSRVLVINAVSGKMARKHPPGIGGLSIYCCENSTGCWFPCRKNTPYNFRTPDNLGRYRCESSHL